MLLKNTRYGGLAPSFGLNAFRSLLAGDRLEESDGVGEKDAGFLAALLLGEVGLPRDQAKPSWLASMSLEATQWPTMAHN